MEKADLNSLAIFAKVVEAKNFSEAAGRLTQEFRFHSPAPSTQALATEGLVALPSSTRGAEFAFDAAHAGSLSFAFHAARSI